MRPWLPMLLAVCACDLPERDVLNSAKAPPPAWVDCDLALDNAKVGDSCLGLSLCTRAEPPCCNTVLKCDGVQIASITRDCTACPPCATDADCLANGQCIALHCEPCLPKTCAECPGPFVKLLRNGCDTCDCAPPQGCGSCGPGQSCATGAYCHQACDGPGCCATFCAATGCADPDPEGCSTDCGAQSCAVCRASGCVCQAGKWSCTSVCSVELKAWSSRCKF